MKRLCLLIMAVFALIMAFPAVGIAQDEIAVLSSSALVAFPFSITFNLEAESSAQIIDIDIEYRVERLSLVPVSCRVDADFTPGLKVEASWNWNMLETGGLPPGTQIEYWWIVEDASGRRIQTPPLTISFDDLRYHWKSLASTPITLYWYHGDQAFAQELMDAAQEALARLAEDTGVALERAVKLYVYASFDELRGALIYPYEWTGGVAFADYGTIAIGIAPDNLSWGKSAIRHELAHLVIHQAVFGPYGDLPRWLDEGLAVYAEGALQLGLLQQLDEAISRDELFSVRSLASSFPADPRQANLCYAQSYSLVAFLLSEYGKEKMLQLLDVFKEGSGYDHALIEVYGFDMDGLNELWRASLGLGPQPAPTPEAEGGFFTCGTSQKTGGGDERGLILLGALLLLPAMVFALSRAIR